MNFVEPIRDRKKIAQIKKLLRGEGRIRDLLLFGWASTRHCVRRQRIWDTSGELLRETSLPSLERIDRQKQILFTALL